MPTITIEHPDGSTETIPGTVADDQGQSWTRTRELGKMRRARINVAREDADAVTLTPKRDIIELGDIDDLRLVDVETGGPTWTLVCYSLEWDANREPHLPGGTTREGTDADLVNGLAADVDSWTTGTVTEQSGPLSFVFNHAHQHEAIRRIEKNVSGEIRFRDRGTIDYVDRLGADKSASVELSASAETIEGEISITDRGRELDGTHIRVLGAHEGEAQLFANLVPQDDPDTYENEVRYSTPRWSGPEDTDWDRWANKDVTDQSTIESEASSIAEEITEPLVEATATTNLTTLDVGDTVSVVKPDADLNRNMRIHRLKEIAEGATRKAKLLLSTRTTLRSDDAEDLQDIQRFNTGFQGSSVADTTGPLTFAVDTNDPFTFPFRYPDLEFENTAEIYIAGLPYRVDSNPEEHSHSVSISSHTHSVSISDHNHSFSVPDHDHTFSVPDHKHSVTVGVADHVHPIRMNDTTIESTADATAGGDIHDHDYDRPTVTENPSTSSTTSETTDNGGGTSTTTDNGGGTSTTTSDGGGTTTTSGSGGDTTTTSDSAAGFVPGIYETTDTPSNVGIEANGETVATDIGSGEFEKVCDVSGVFTKGEWNDVTISSDSLGRVLVSVFIEGYDQIGQQ